METEVQIPVDFPYRDILLKGRPVHDKYDPFTISHPPMPASRWAKIYAPFDALRGFKESVQTKTVQYEEKRVLSENEQELLDQKIRILKEKIPDARAARENPVRVSVTCYMPCTDVDSEAYGVMGTHETITGICWYIDTDILNIIRIDRDDIRIEDITKIEILPHYGPGDDVWQQ